MKQVHSDGAFRGIWHRLWGHMRTKAVKMAQGWAQKTKLLSEMLGPPFKDTQAVITSGLKDTESPLGCACSRTPRAKGN